MRLKKYKEYKWKFKFNYYVKYTHPMEKISKERETFNFNKQNVWSQTGIFWGRGRGMFDTKDLPWESFDIRQNLMTCYLQSLIFQILLEVLYIFYDVSV